MVLTPLQQQLLMLGFWGIMLFLAALILRLTSSYIGADMPSWRRAIFMVLFVGPAAYLVFDLSSYVIMLAIQDVMLRVPPDYSYTNWFREPLPLKWHIISMVPFIKHIPVIFAICAAGVLQAITLQLSVTFRRALVIFVVQWALTILTMFALSFVVNMGLGVVGRTIDYTANLQGDDQQASGQTPSRTLPPGHSDLAMKSTPPESEPTLRTYLTSLKHNLDPFLEEIKTGCEPVTRHLPQGIQEFLAEGGWWLVIGALGVLALIWALALLNRMMRTFFKPRKRKKKKKKPRTRYLEADLSENLGELGDVYTEEGDQMVTIKGLPARTRLVLLAAGSRDVTELTPEMADRLLDLMRPGLAAIVAHDSPRIALWPPQYSSEAFPTLFASKMRIPDPKGAPSRWVLVSGTVEISRQKIHVGLALLTEKPNLLRQVVVPGGDWPGILGVVQSTAV